MMKVLDLLTYMIGEYDKTLMTPDWSWIMSAGFLLLVTWGIIIIVRSVISRV